MATEFAGTIEYRGVTPQEQGYFSRLQGVMAKRQRLPFSTEWVIKANGDMEILIRPDGDFADIEDFVRTLSLGHSTADLETGRIVSRSDSADSSRGGKTFGQPGLTSSHWRADRERNCLVSPGQPLHQMMQPEILYKDIPGYLLSNTKRIWQENPDYVHGYVTDEINGYRYIVTEERRSAIFMSNAQAYRKGVSDYFSQNYQPLVENENRPG